jgi:ribosomal-protein-alanine N-acetyltransferase
MVTHETMLRRATEADGCVLSAIHASAFRAADAWGSEVFRQQLGLPGVFGLLHRLGGMILLRVAADEAEILTLAVAPEVRRGGIAQALLREAASIGATAGADAMFLEVSVGNTAARAAYGRAGFLPIGRRRAYYSDRSDALVLRLGLRRPA